MKRWIGCSVVTLSVAAGVVIVGAWSLLSYHVLVREQLEVEAYWSRIENVYYRRWSQVCRLAEMAGDLGADRALSDSLAESCDATSRIILSPEILRSPERLDELERIEAVQGAIIDETLDSLGAAGSGPRAIRALKEDLDASGETLGVEQSRFNDAVDDYNRRIGRFPMSLFARLYGFDRNPRVDPGLAPSAHAGSVSP